MTRWLLGSFDRESRIDDSRLTDAIAPAPSAFIEAGPLRLAYSGPPAATGDQLCLLDGYIDNVAELETALQSPACRSIEELLALAYRRWGPALPARLRGDFALLVWDRERGEGLLARDQLGIRSLFLHEGTSGLSFASELRHLLELLPHQPAPDPVGVAHWIAISGRPGSGTLYEGIRRLDPGSMLLFTRAGTRTERYWSPRFVGPLDLPSPELHSRIRESVERAVRRRLDPGGVTGVLMSGGLDSSSIAAVAAAQAPAGTVAAYSAVFPDHPAVDESGLIAGLRDTLGLGGVTAEVRSGGLLASALTWIEAWKLPLTSWGEFWAGPLLRAAASAGVGTMLGGDGGDELFDCRAYLMADRLRSARPGEVLALARLLPGVEQDPARGAGARAALRFGLAGALPAGLHGVRLESRERRRLPRWLRAAARRDVSYHADPLAWKRLDGPRWWAFDAHTLTRGVEELGVFENHRRRAALAGLQSRHPLFDLDLLELGLRLPPLATFDRSRDRPLLRASMEGLLPDVVRMRRTKARFDSLLIACMTGPDGVAIHRLLSNPAARLGAYVDMPSMRRTLLERGSRGEQGGFRWMYQLWRLATAECWLRAQEDGGTEALADELRCSPACVTMKTVPAGH
jgi:asparagine synthase (glutamine-hydrolysing)